MRVEVRAPTEVGADLVAVGIPVVIAGDPPRPTIARGITEATFAAVPAELDAGWCEQRRFTGEVGQTALWRAGAPGGVPGSQAEVVLVGVGDTLSGSPDGVRESLRRAAAAFVRSVVRSGSAAFLLPDLAAAGIAVDGGAAALSEGASLASYRYDAYRTGDRPGSLDALVVAVSDSAVRRAAEGAARGARVAESVTLARDLVNQPPSSLTPERFADTFVQRFASTPTLSIEVWDESRIVAERLGGLLGVARGSVEEPRLVRVEYMPSDPWTIDDRIPHLALVGKGITFDSGGLSLKTATGMETMKTDMSGAAAVLAAVDALAGLGGRLRITAIAPLTENMPGGSATKPGDVLTTRSGKTIEVLNTDAEGRLVLADGLTLATEAGPDAIVDLATLTGAAIVALGKQIGGLLGNDERLIGEVREAADRAGEALWPLPLPDDYRSHIDSDVADMRNMGRAGEAGSIAAAMLLREFVAGVPWAHLDIAGPARSDESTRYLSKGGTGFGVRTLVALATSESFATSLVRAPTASA